ncbi:MAG: NMD3-related protein [Candidatus Woesearchaeota archaeon]|nr:NMD3-related protein [Candidatus Woesearchaeota archaeon]
MNFCPRCGKKDIVGDFCKACHAEMIGGIIEFKEIKIKICPLCMSYSFKNKQTKFDDIAVVIRKIAKESMKEKITADITPMLPEIEYRPGKKYQFEIEIALSNKEKYYIPAEIEMEVCKKCSKMGTKYFEGVLQLRNSSKEVMDFIRKEVGTQRSRGIFITDEKEVKDGVDIFITSQRYLQNLGQKLQNTFGGMLKINPRLFSRNRQTSKDVHRVNVYFELLGYKRGDVVKHENNLIKISATGKQIAGYNIVTGKSTAFSSKDKVKTFDVKKAEVVKVYPDVEVMDPETYQPLRIENKKKVVQGEIINIIIDEGKAYIV